LNIFLESLSKQHLPRDLQRQVQEIYKAISPQNPQSIQTRHKSQMLKSPNPFQKTL